MAERPSDAVQAEDHYRRGLAELHRYLFDFESGSLAHAVEAFRLATDHGSDTSSYWVGLGFALDASDSPREALTAFERAYALDPEDEEVEVFVLTLLSELGPENEALAAVEARAERTGVDLESLRSELAEAEMVCDARTLVMNAFIRARNFVRSRLEDEIERLRRAQAPTIGPGRSMRMSRTVYSFRPSWRAAWMRNVCRRDSERSRRGPSAWGSATTCVAARW